MFNLKPTVFSQFIRNIYPDPKHTYMHPDTHDMIRFHDAQAKARRSGIELIVAKTGKIFEMRPATQRDLSVIHMVDNPVAMHNDGWLRHFDDGEWTGHMIRPHDPKERAVNLARYMAELEPKQLEAPVGVLSELTNNDKYGDKPRLDPIRTSEDGVGEISPQRIEMWKSQQRIMSEIVKPFDPTPHPDGCGCGHDH